MLLLLQSQATISWEHMFLTCAVWLLLAATLSHSLLHLSRHMSQDVTGATKGTMTVNVLGSKLSPL
jgi:hypothetical protein